MGNPSPDTGPASLRIRVRGIVQGVGFRPHVYRIARRHGLAGWVCNGESGVEIHVEGSATALAAFRRDLEQEAPAAARIASLDAQVAAAEGFDGFTIRESQKGRAPTVRVSPDLAVCAACLDELRDPRDRRYGYPYLNCTACGPRYSIIRSLPYDRPRTTMRDWPMCPDCQREYDDPADRRFHAQPVACPRCGPTYHLAPPPGKSDPPGDEQALQDEGSRGRERPLQLVTVPRAFGHRRGPKGLLQSDLEQPFRAAAMPMLTGEPTKLERPFTAAGIPMLNGKPSPSLPTPHSPLSGHGGTVLQAVEWLKAGQILAIKGIGGYHLACDAQNPIAVGQLRERKFRKEKPFAVMARDATRARDLVDLSTVAAALLESAARPIVLAEARVELPGVAPGNDELGVMLPYTPLHHLLFDAGAPPVLVMTSANRSDEPIAYADADAFARLAGLADAFLVGERPIARRIDDSVARVGPFGRMVLRRARGLAPAIVATLPTQRPILAVGADLKNAVTLVVAGEALVSQHLGDLEHLATYQSFETTVTDLAAMYEVTRDDLLVVHDLHPAYASTRFASEQPGPRLAVQHHRAHVASVLAERGAGKRSVIGFAFDGTGYGDDGTIWGGEVFVGNLVGGLVRRAHLRAAALPGGDAAARFPVQAAAGFLAQVPDAPDLRTEPFGFPERYRQASQLVARNVRTFSTTSMGRLFDVVAALVGFTRASSFEGQAAIWLEQLAHRAGAAAPYPFPFADGELDFRPLLTAIILDRLRGRDPAAIARAFHESVAEGVDQAARSIATATGIRTVVLSGGVFQNVLLLGLVRKRLLAGPEFEVWVNQEVPPNDGGISLGQAALAARMSASAA